MYPGAAKDASTLDHPLLIMILKYDFKVH
jgi:hypothetical protein